MTLLRVYFVVIALLAPTFVPSQRAIHDWTVVIVTAERNPYAEWCPECGGLQSLGVHRVPRGRR